MGKGGRKGGKGGKGKGKGRREGEDGPKALGVSSELHTAAREGDVQKIEALLSDAPGADGDGGVRPVNAPDQHRRSPLHMAAFFGKAEAVQKLLEKSADPHLQAMDGFLPLHFAAQSGHLEVLKLIVRHLGSKGEFGVVKKHVNAIVAKGKKSALHLALLKGHQDCARFLVMKGASVELKTSQGQAALEICTSEELKEELASKAKVAKETNQEDKEEKEKQNKEVDATEAEEPAAKKQKTMPAMSGAVAPLEGLPEAPVQLDASAAPPGLLACGPYSLDKVQISLEGEKSYPAGIPAMADVEWDLLTKEEPERVDGPVLCLRTRETTGGTLHLKMLKSKKKLLHYTHFSDEALLMDKDSKCNACGLILLLETSDGHLLIHQSGEQTWELCAGEVTTSDLAQAIAQVLLTALPNSQQKDSQDVLASMRILGLLDVKEAPRGHRHELVAAGRLPFAASKVGALGEAPKLRFLPRSPDIQASEEVATMALEDFLNATSAEPLQRAAVALLRALRAWKA